MIFTTGNVFDHVDKPLTYSFITTNLGWKLNGENVMGAGVAKEAATRFPKLPKWYGTICQQIANGAAHHWITFAPHDVAPVAGWLGCFPTKILDRQKPHLSWQRDSTLHCIERSCIELKAHHLDIIAGKPVYLPLPGCGNGGLDPKDVRPLLLKYFRKVPNLTVLERK